MRLEPKDLYEKLEFDKVIELVAAECLGELGVEQVHKIRPTDDVAWIDRRLKEVNELRLIIGKNEKFPIQVYFNIMDELRMLDIEGYTLDVEGLQKINRLLLIIRDIYRFFNKDRRDIYPTLYEIIRVISFDNELVQAIEKVIDVKGEIRADASPELQKIRKSINSRQRDLDKEFKAVIGKFKQLGYLTDSEETFRNGRRVLSVPSEHKRKIRGIIHDESATGKTAFIEPEAVIEINNDIFDLEQEERREIFRLLKALSSTLRPYTPQMRSYLSLAERFDVLQAKARIALRMKAGMPRLHSKPRLGILKGFHPLLLLKNQETGKKTVPFDLTLLHENRILVISGPNAGGKSITMKAVGLIQMMFQSGMLVPVHEISDMGVFDNIFADIGDQQSLEDELSTYSSRLHNARNFLEYATENSLILIDEFGAGTDPLIGGAIAEAILKSLNEKNVFGVLNTHFSNLKIFAFNTKGLLNGCMLFDKDTLSPTYELRIGRPGSSYAFEIAEKVGLPKKVLAYAKHRTGKNEKAVDELLIDLQREKQEVEEHLAEILKKQKNLDHLIKSYEDMSKDYEYRRKKLKLDIKESELQQTSRENHELEKLIREIREKQNLEKAKELAAERRAERERLVEVVEEINSEIHYQSVTRKDVEKGPIKAGDLVKAIKGGAQGKVELIHKNKATVIMGDLRIEFKISDLQHANEQLNIISAPRVRFDFVSQSALFESNVDLRGMKMFDAMITLENFIDRALMTSVQTITVLHGKGDGILRRAVKDKMKEYKALKNHRHPKADAGGDGITMVDIG
jgi:DNA mismatch repair protein MutS2